MGRDNSLGEMDDPALVSAARQGDPRAFGELVSRSMPRLLRLAHSILGERGAEDAVQDAVADAWRSVHAFRGEAAFGTWLYRIVIRACMRQARPEREPEPSQEVDELVEAERRFMDPAYTVDPAEVVARLSDAQELHRALDALPAVYRVAVVLHDADGLTALEVADATGAPLGTAKARIRRGRIALLARLAQGGVEMGRAGGRQC